MANILREMKREMKISTYWMPVRADRTVHGTFEGYAGESTEWDTDFVRVIIKLPKKKAMQLQNNNLVRIVF
jgi:hypothetical protein